MRLIVFGCSCPYGHGLPDCLQDDGITQGDTPSKTAYPALVANKLNYGIKNCAKSGNSNKEIWNDVVNFNFRPDDIAIINWTCFSRFCIIHSDKIKRLNPWNSHQKLFFMNYSNRNDMILDFYLRLNHVSFYLNSKGVPNYNFLIEEPDFQPDWSLTSTLGKFEILDKADDSSHPGPVSHSRFAEYVYDIIISSQTN